MQVTDVLSSDPEVLSGAVVFRGTRASLDALFEYPSNGSSMDDFLDDFPTVEREQVEAVLLRAAADLKQTVEPAAA